MYRALYLVLPLAIGGAGCSFDTSAAERTAAARSFTVGHAPAETLRDVPILVALDPSVVDYDAAGTDASSLTFRDQGGVLLDVDVERWQPGGVSHLWVRLPEIAAGAQAQFFMSYEPGNTGGAAAVWDDQYMAVWHLADSAVDEENATIHRDASGHGASGVQAGNQLVTDAVGVIGGAQAFDGEDDYIEVASSGMLLEGEGVTLLARALINATPNAYPHVLGAGNDGRYWQIFWDTGQARWFARYQIDGVKGTSGSEVAATAEWVTIASVYDGAEISIYVNGEFQESVPMTGNLDALDTPLFLGNNPALSPRAFDGLLDEVRVAKAARSADWLLLQHLSLSGQLLVVE